MITDQSGFAKLLYSDQIPSGVGACMQLLYDPKRWVKAASPIFDVDPARLTAPKGHVAIHVVSLGDFETYGANRNADTFPKQACAERHGTFVKHGHVYRGHNNRDPANALGKIAASAYNAPMGRIELMLHVDEKKASDELHTLATTGEHPFSMACKVPNDRCTVCNNLRKSAADPNQCSHIRDHLGEVWEDGTLVATHNDEPVWFDQSFVKRGADRLSWNLSKVASTGVMDGVKQAECAGIWTPDALYAAVPGYAQKCALVTKLAGYEALFSRLATAGRCNTHYERYLWNMPKAAAWDLPDDVIDDLRRDSPEDVLGKLAQHGVILSAPAFFKFAMGADYGAIKDSIGDILAHVRSGLYSNLYKQGGYQRVCRNTYFDVDADRAALYGMGEHGSASYAAVVKTASAGSFVGHDVDQRIIEATVHGRQPVCNVLTFSKSAGVEGVHRGAEIYAAYKLSALDAVMSCHDGENKDRLLALAAAQNMVQ